jgi:hypothetical protein
MKTLQLLLAMLAIAGPGLAQGTWGFAASMGAPGVRWASGFVINGKGYVGTGTTNSANTNTATFREFDPSSNTWTSKASVGGQPRSRAVGMSIGNKGYIGTGVTQGGYVKDWWEYDASQDTWTARAPVPGANRIDAIGFSVNGKGYVGGGLGANNTIFSDFHEYNPATNTWTQKGSLGASGPRGAVATFVIGQKAYVVAGHTNNSTVFSKATYEYNPLTDNWTLKAPFPGTGRLNPAGFSIAGKGYVGTGMDTFAKSDFWQYDPATNQWQLIPSVAGSPRTSSVGFAIGNTGYVVAGYSFGTYLDDALKFTPAGITGTEEPVSDGVSIYPTLTTGLVYLQGVKEDELVTVLNITGQALLTQRAGTSLDLSQLPEGLYLLTLPGRRLGYRVRLHH